MTMDYNQFMAHVVFENPNNYTEGQIAFLSNRIGGIVHCEPEEEDTLSTEEANIALCLCALLRYQQTQPKYVEFCSKVLQWRNYHITEDMENLFRLALGVARVCACRKAGYVFNEYSIPLPRRDTEEEYYNADQNIGSSEVRSMCFDTADFIFEYEEDLKRRLNSISKTQIYALQEVFLNPFKEGYEDTAIEQQIREVLQC